ncbi:MAG TPA: VOC family protein [Candidatus Limnocylindrales bacterium]|nr:VOC family protein [Candidatus Limnocylindrales bacterium]
MRVRGIVWAGTRTDRFDETVAFFRDVIGVPLAQEGREFAWGKLPDTSQLEVFGLGEHPEFTTGPVPEFLVDDLAGALDELQTAGIEILGDVHLPAGAGDDGWVHFRAPDGNVYGLTTGASYTRPLRA